MKCHRAVVPLAVLVLVTFGSAACRTAAPARRAPQLPASSVVNDVHAGLNPTRVHEVVAPRSVEDVQAVVRRARAEGRAVSIAGARHAMGGQQFGEDTILIDMTGMNRILDLDRERGIVSAEAGVTWPDLVSWLVRTQSGGGPQWGIRQKQTGADRLTLGGALSANAHGRGLAMKPIVGDVESFTVVDAGGRLLRCSREENSELFRLAIGGYGLFGVIATVELRLVPRRKLERVVEVVELADLPAAFEQRIAEGYLYGDFQFAVDPRSPDFLRQGVFSCYRPVPDDTAISEGQAELSPDEWHELSYLTHVEPWLGLPRSISP